MRLIPHRPFAQAASGLALVGLAAVLAGCGPTCQDSCRRMYAEDQCDAGTAGLSTETVIGECTRVCQSALQVPGPDVDAADRRFNPEVLVPAGSAPTLENERQAAAWMDCVWFYDDDECQTRLPDGYCLRVQ